MLPRIRIECVKPDHPETTTQRRTVLHTDEVPKELSIPVPRELHEGKIYIEQVPGGFGFDELVAKNAVERCDLFASVEDNRIKFPVVMSASRIEATIDATGERVPLDKTFSYVFPPHTGGTLHFVHGSSLDQFCFFLPASIVEKERRNSSREVRRKMEAFLKELPARSHAHSGMCLPEAKMIVREIRTCSLEGSLRSLFIEGKILEFLALELQYMKEAESRNGERLSTSFSSKERKRLQDALGIISENFSNHLTISTLARVVGLNTTKLKNGFKSEYGTSIFAYVYRLRMEQAIKLLHDTDKSIGEIAHEVGYRSVSGFSAAFHRQFGLTPSQVRSGKHSTQRDNQ
ncbi:MAG: helix-turn-helix transcriptional regulator [Sediminispirochaetaceae bacterium]